MDDQTVKLSMQDAGREMDRRFPGRTWAFFVFPAELGQQAHYCSSAPRKEVLNAFRDLGAAGLPGIPGDPSHS